MKNMNVVAVILWRVFQALVILPAGLAGTVVLAFALAGESPSHDAVREIFHRAEIAVRAAPVGTDVVIACVTPKAGFSESPPKTFCNDTAPKAGPIEAAIDDVVGNIKRAYWALVTVSFVSMLLALSRRRFIGLQSTAACRT